MSFLENFRETLSEQEWWNTLKSKWDELDSKTRSVLAWAGAISFIATIAGALILGTISVKKLKKDLDEKNLIATQLDHASQEMRALREKNSNLRFAGESDNTNLGTYFIAKASTFGVDQTKVTVSAPKPGTENDLSKETLYDIQLKKVSLKQVVRLSHALENGDRIVKLKNLQIENISDPKGYLDAKLSLSTFAPVSEE